MGIFESMIARLMFAVLTAGIGLICMQTQSDFWFGVMVSIVVCWGVMAIGGAIRRGNRKQSASWSAFLITLGVVLVYGFGPWSDLATRGSLPQEASFSKKYIASTLFTTHLFLRNRGPFKSSDRQEVYTLDPSGRPDMHLVATGPDRDSHRVYQTIYDLERTLDPDMDAFTRKYSGPRCWVVTQSYKVYLNTCYLFSSLLIAAIIGWCAGLLLRRSPECNQSSEMSLMLDLKLTGSVNSMHSVRKPSRIAVAETSRDRTSLLDP